mmetsp:Transcript_4243/g.10213  ORF Transcript_4243/g.10213 Transcript_4243/m.10213 type:complete len:237 (-) Transcript_4243:450-1160(-)
MLELRLVGPLADQENVRCGSWNVQPDDKPLPRGSLEPVQDLSRERHSAILASHPGELTASNAGNLAGSGQSLVARHRLEAPACHDASSPSPAAAPPLPARVACVQLRLWPSSVRPNAARGGGDHEVAMRHRDACPSLEAVQSWQVLPLRVRQSHQEGGAATGILHRQLWQLVRPDPAHTREVAPHRLRGSPRGLNAEVRCCERQEGPCPHRRRCFPEHCRHGSTQDQAAHRVANTM